MKDLSRAKIMIILIFTVIVGLYIAFIPYQIKCYSYDKISDMPAYCLLLIKR